MTRLLDGEQTERVARQHWSVFVPVVASCVALLVVAGVVLKLLPGSVSGHSLHDVKIWAFVVLVLFSLAVFSLRWLRWSYTTYTLTNLRILSASGVLSRRTESISLDRVQDTSVSQNLLERMLSAGSVEIESAGREGREVFRLIADPQGFSNALQAAVEAHRRGLAVGAQAPTPAPGPPDEGGGGPPPAGTTRSGGL